MFLEIEKINNIYHRWEKIYHLSTSMYPINRKRIIDLIRKDLRNGIHLVVLSTQLIEAGVDFDFPIVYRAISPIDSIVQAAGRCNREGKLESGHVYLFELEEGGSPLGIYQLGTDQTRAILQQKGVEALHYLDTYMRYFRSLYSLTGEEGLDEKEIMKLPPFSYPEVARRFKMIDQDTIQVLIEFPADNEDANQVDKLIKQLLTLQTPTRNWYRKAQKYSVALYRNSYFVRENAHLLQPIIGDWFVWKGDYETSFGIASFSYVDVDKYII